MQFYSLDQFLRLFDGPNSKTFAQFMQNAKVMIGSGKHVPLKIYAKERNILVGDLKLLYENILNRREYLSRFYVKSLRPIDPVTIIEKPMPKNNMNNDSLPNYKNIIRNLHMHNILQKTKSGLDNLPSFMDVLYMLYLEEIIDYKILTPSARHYMREGRLGSVFSSFYFRASIMNPYLVYSLCQKVLCDKKSESIRVFSPTLGWTSYAYGFMECPMVDEYVATDVIPEVCKISRDFCRRFYPDKKSTIFCQPSEKLYENLAFTKKYAFYFDIVFFSPPYYELEMYPGSQQSTEIHKTYADWLENYWLATVKLCHHVLKKGGRMCYILSSYGCSGSDKCANNTVDIMKDMNAITGDFFKKIATIPMKNKNVHVTSGAHRETGERIMVYIK